MSRLPLLRPALLLALLFRTIDALRVFDLVYVMTQGGPADATNVLSFYGYKKIFAEGMIGYGSAIAVGVFLLSLTLSLVYLQHSQVQPFGRDAAMKRAAMLAIFSGGIARLLSGAVSLVCAHFVEESRGAHRDSAAADSVLSLGLLSLGIGRTWLTPLHRQQHHRRRHGDRASPSPSVRWRPTLWPAFSSRGQMLICSCCLRFRCFRRSPSPARSGTFSIISSGSTPIEAWWRPTSRFRLPLATWILTTFFREVPHEIEEAALIDGCSRLQALYKIVLPIAAPGIFTAALLVFIYAWNEFFFALIILTDPNVQTLPVGIALFPGEYTMPWGEIAAASTLATLPLIFSRYLFSAASCAACRRAR